ncbi:MAG TPA: GNAT family N-acetyltransferase [Sphingomicrobium sp.]|nr:GNAT family N-acetyltransferase [Sphingomicrobium sp.]
MSNSIFRRARVEDLATIVQLLRDDVLGQTREASSESVGEGYTAAFAAIDADPNQLLVVADDEKEVVGTLQLSFIPGLARKGAWRGQIEAVRVASSRRGHGIGREMIEWAVAECRRRGCSHVQLTTDRRRIDAHRFYDRLGFVASHLGYKLTI